MSEKDSFGDKLRDKQKAEEDRFFADRDRAALEKLRQASEAAAEGAVRAGAKGRCPKDGSALTVKSVEGVEVDECAACGGIWLDAGELERVSARESSGFFGLLLRSRR